MRTRFWVCKAITRSFALACTMNVEPYFPCSLWKCQRGLFGSFQNHLRDYSNALKLTAWSPWLPRMFNPPMVVVIVDKLLHPPSVKLVWEIVSSGGFCGAGSIHNLTNQFWCNILKRLLVTGCKQLCRKTAVPRVEGGCTNKFQHKYEVLFVDVCLSAWFACFCSMRFYPYLVALCWEVW